MTELVMNKKPSAAEIEMELEALKQRARSSSPAAIAIIEAIEVMNLGELEGFLAVVTHAAEYKAIKKVGDLGIESAEAVIASITMGEYLSDNNIDAGTLPTMFSRRLKNEEAEVVEVARSGEGGFRFTGFVTRAITGSRMFPGVGDFKKWTDIVANKHPFRNADLMQRLFQSKVSEMRFGDRCARVRSPEDELTADDIRGNISRINMLQGSQRAMAAIWIFWNSNDKKEFYVRDINRVIADTGIKPPSNTTQAIETLVSRGTLAVGEGQFAVGQHKRYVVVSEKRFTAVLSGCVQKQSNGPAAGLV